ncbi:hypothetical protein OS493_005745 [Desmophyllum pertusum]|uniref:Uncharacterized protein n=1 Tax=Desmophyllum pertusum TaxID=174260 RepID=A0A9X0CGH0_9CNID|nr:hypothetical protein OS493_005745 [Desmophyllum pertusum]
MSSDSETADKRVSRCPGCKTPLEEHHWGIPSKFCEGVEKSSPKREQKEATSCEDETPILSTLAAELEALELEELELRRQDEEEKLRQKITEKRRIVQELRMHKSRPQDVEDCTKPLTTKDLQKLDLVGNQEKTPLDSILGAMGPLQHQQPIPTWVQQEPSSQRPRSNDVTERQGMLKHNGNVPETKQVNQG